MAALKCEICGGKLIGKPGGIFECDSCGMEYSTEWAKQKIQEIRGTVQVEGTVEVQGTVKIDGPVQVEGGVNAESLLKRGEMALEDQKWDEAADFFNQVLNFDAESCRAYLGLAQADLHCTTLDVLKDTYFAQPNSCKTNKNFQRALRFSDTELNALIVGWDSERQSWFEHKRQGIFQARSRIGTSSAMISTGCWFDDKPEWHIVGLYRDGSVTAVGDDTFGQCDVDGWHDIVAVSSAGEHTVGLKANGTVVAVGKNQFGQCDIGDWRNIIAVSVGFQNTAGLREDGTVVIVGDNESGQCAVRNWTDIIEVSICAKHTVGLRSDGTVVAVGCNENGRCDVSEWRDIVAVSAGTVHTVGLRADGTVVAVGDNELGQCDVSQWRDIISVSATGLHTIGLKRDGTVVAVGLDQFGENQVNDWENIVAVSAGGFQTVGLKSDGSVVIAHKGAVPPRWNLFNRAIEILETEKAALMAELPTLTGLFSGGRRRQIKGRLAEIEAELRRL